MKFQIPWRSRSGQGTVETMLLVAVMVIGVVAAIYPIFSDDDGIASRLEAFGEGAKTVYYCDPDSDGNCDR